MQRALIKKVDLEVGQGNRQGTEVGRARKQAEGRGNIQRKKA